MNIPYLRVPKIFNNSKYIRYLKVGYRGTYLKYLPYFTNYLTAAAVPDASVNFEHLIFNFSSGNRLEPKICAGSQPRRFFPFGDKLYPLTTNQSINPILHLSATSLSLQNVPLLPKAKHFYSPQLFYELLQVAAPIGTCKGAWTSLTI